MVVRQVLRGFRDAGIGDVGGAPPTTHRLGPVLDRAGQRQNGARDGAPAGVRAGRRDAKMERDHERDADREPQAEKMSGQGERRVAENTDPVQLRLRGEQPEPDLDPRTAARTTGGLATAARHKSAGRQLCRKCRLGP